VVRNRADERFGQIEWVVAQPYFTSCIDLMIFCERKYIASWFDDAFH